MSDDMEILTRIRENQELYWAHFRGCEWMENKPTEYDVLKKNIGFAFFGSPILPDESDEEASYNEEQLKFIDDIFKLIKTTKREHQDQDNIWVSYVCVCSASTK